MGIGGVGGGGVGRGRLAAEEHCLARGVALELVDLGGGEDLLLDGHGLDGYGIRLELARIALVLWLDLHDDGAKLIVGGVVGERAAALVGPIHDACSPTCLRNRVSQWQERRLAAEGVLAGAVREGGAAGGNHRQV